jgi:two-component system OmpR family sensor kinase
MDIVDFSKEKENYKLYVTNSEIYSYFDLLGSKESLLKLSYDFEIYNTKLNEIKVRVILLFFVVSFILLVYSFFYSLYALKPYKEAINLMERFLRDIIHDLNTPISAIFINLALLKRSYNLDAIKRVEYSTQTISSLYKNLDLYSKNIKFSLSKIDLLTIINQRVEYFKKLYPSINFNTPLTSIIVTTNEIAIVRILDNIISNGCKYNKDNGTIDISFSNNILTIKDSGYGIKNPQKAFDRFYKESDRGMGIGLSIVKKLSKEIDVEVELDSEVDIGTTVRVIFGSESI